MKNAILLAAALMFCGAVVAQEGGTPPPAAPSAPAPAKKAKKSHKHGKKEKKDQSAK